MKLALKVMKGRALQARLIAVRLFGESEHEGAYRRSLRKPPACEYSV